MNEVTKKDNNEINNGSPFAQIAILAANYIQASNEPSLQEFLEMVESTDFNMKKKAATGIYKVAYFKITGKKL